MKDIVKSTFKAGSAVISFGLMLAGPMGDATAQESAGFAWKMLSGAFSSASNWTTDDPDLEVPGSDDHTARIPPRAGDSVSFPDGHYVVAMAGAPNLLFIEFVAIGNETFDVSLQDGPVMAGDAFLPGKGRVVFQGGLGNLSRVFPGGGEIYIAEGANVTFGDIPSAASLPNFPSDEFEVVVAEGGRLTTAGRVNLKSVLVDDGIWDHTGPSDAFGKSDTIMRSPAVYVSNKGVFRTGAIETSQPLYGLNGGRFEIGHLSSLFSIVQLQSGSSMLNSEAEAGSSPGIGDSLSTFVDGLGTHWDVDGTLLVNPAGVIYVRNGGALSAGTLAFDRDVSGSVVAQDPSSTVTIDNPLAWTSSSTVRAMDGAVVTFAGADIERGGLDAQGAGSEIRSDGMVNLRGGSFSVTGGARGAAEQISVFNGSAFAYGPGSSIEVSGDLAAVGDPAADSDAIISTGGGARLDSQDATIGFSGKGSGMVSGADSLWLVGNSLLVGGENSSEGTLTIDTGGRMQVGREDAVSDSAVAIGLEAGSEGTLVARDSDSALDARFIQKTGVGVSGKGTLRVEHGARARALQLTAGVKSEGDGTVRVVGPSSSLEVDDKLVVGKEGLGVLELQNGGLVFAPYAWLGNSSSDNRALVTGADSTLTVHRELMVGYDGKAALNVENEGRVASADPGVLLGVGEGAGSDGTFTVDGAGSTVEFPQGITAVGNAGQGTLALSGGATMAVSILRAGFEKDSSGFVTVTGDGSVLRVNRFTEIGSAHNPAPGSLAVADLGLVTIAKLLGVSPSGTVQLDGGRISVGTVAMPPEAGVLRVGAGGRMTLLGRFSGGKIVVDANGRFVLGVSSQVIPGSESQLAAQAEGGLAPASSPEVATIEGNFEQAAGSVLEVDIGGAEPGTQFGVLEVSGNVKLSGELLLNFVDGFAPQQGQTFSFIRSSAGNRTGEFDNVRVVGLMPGFEHNLQTGLGGELQLVALNDGAPAPPPEPPPLNVRREGTQIMVSWPDAGANEWVLESAWGLTRGFWSEHPAQANPLTISPEAPAEFFRLAYRP